MERLSIGTRLPHFEAQTLRGHSIDSESLAVGATHLCFHRYAACPVCNNVLAPFRVHHGDLEAAGVRTLAVFHSPREKLERYFPGGVPFEILVDPEFRLYDLFGVRAKRSILFHPKSIRAMARSVGGAVSVNPLAADGTLSMAPADFFISDGVITSLNYGEHLDDSWTVQDVLRRREECRELEATPARV